MPQTPSNHIENHGTRPSTAPTDVWEGSHIQFLSALAEVHVLSWRVVKRHAGVHRNRDLLASMGASDIQLQTCVGTFIIDVWRSIWNDSDKLAGTHFDKVADILVSSFRAHV